jgi:hypothetical protein
MTKICKFLFIVIFVLSVMALANRTIIRIDQDGAPDKLEEIDISKAGIKLAVYKT